MDYLLQCEVCKQKWNWSFARKQDVGRTVSVPCKNCSPRFLGSPLPHKVLEWKGKMIITMPVTLK